MSLVFHNKFKFLQGHYLDDMRVLSLGTRLFNHPYYFVIEEPFLIHLNVKLQNIHLFSQLTSYPNRL